MKRCPTCHKTFSDRNLSFCLDDGTPLQTISETDDEVTVVSSPAGESDASPGPTAPKAATPAYQPPGSYAPPGSAPGQSGRRAWPWILGIVALLLILFAGLGIAASYLIPKLINPGANRNTANSNANVERRNDSNWNSNLSNSNSEIDNTNLSETPEDDDTTPAPTDQDEVLSDLTDLEHEWTVANINADKKKLERILADDYAGTSADGKPQGKTEYLATIKRDTTIQKWEFEDLKASLKGDRASITGTIKLVITDQQGQAQNVAFHFTDKFVWRDGRWQATGSEVTPVK